MRPMVTGGLGVNGSWVVRRLVESGVRPLVVDRREDFSLLQDCVGRFDLVVADIGDREGMIQLLQAQGVDRIIHLAAYISPDMDQEPWTVFEVNAHGTVVLLEAAHRAGVGRFVFASSRAVYGETPRGVGEPGYRPLHEDHPKNPVMAYDVCKLASENMGCVYRNAFGLEFAALRFAGIYGPGKQARHGKMSLRSRLVEDPFEGRPVVVPAGGDQLDDMIYVEDVADALTRAALAERLPHAAYNIASGVGRTLADFAAAVKQALPAARIDVGPGLNPLGHNVHYYAIYDVTRAREDLGFSPRFDLTAGVARYVETLRRWRGGQA